jgi:lysophospholipase L1-like esterase
MGQANKIHTYTTVYMGDSITEGQYVHHSLRWTEIVSRKLRASVAINIDADTLHFFNRGISGETTRQGLERFPRDVQVLEPLVMTLQFGLNDCNCWESDGGLPRVSEAAYHANLVEMIARARVFGTTHIILSTNHPTLRHQPLPSGQSLEARRKIYNDIVRDVAAKCQVVLCDIDAAFSDLGSSELSGMLLAEPDLLHLSPKGHEKYAEFIYPQLLSFFN